MEKYRALRKDGGGWAYYQEKHHIPYKSLPTEEDFGHHPIDISTLGRYTGRRDRHNMLIYGGDIVEDDGKKFRVCFHKGLASIYNKDSGYQSIDMLDFEFCKIIGNIFETHE